MYYKVSKESKTGKKFEEFYNKCTEVREKAYEAIKHLGVKEWYQNGFAIDGGVSAVKFEEDPDPKYWKSMYGDAWAPKRNTKFGKELAKKLDALPLVHRRDLNRCIGSEERISHIGYAHKDGYTYFSLPKTMMDHTLPDDVIEVVYSEFKAAQGE